MNHNDFKLLVQEQGEEDFLKSTLHQKFALYLNELEGDEPSYNALLDRIQAKVEGDIVSVDNEDDSRKITIPTELDALKNTISIIEEDELLKEKLKLQIESQSFDVLMYQAGFAENEIDDIKQNDDVYFNLQLQKLYHDKIGAAHLPENERNNAFVSALSSVKDGILKTLGNPNVKVALGAVGIAAAVATSGGAFALGLAGTRLASSLFEHDKVTGLMNKFANKVTTKLIDNNVISQETGDAVLSGGSKLKKFFTSKGFKAAVTVASVGGLLCAVSSLMPGAQDLPAIARDGAPVDLTSSKDALATATTEATNAANAATVVTIEAGDNAWKIAEEHFKSLSGGVNPTPQQVVAMVNDMELSNPGIIKPGDTVSLSNDLTKYATDEIGKVNADWLTSDVAAQNSVTGVNLGDSLPSSIDISASYDIGAISQANFNGASLGELANQNPGLDLHSLEAGDEITYNGEAYVVPSAESLVISHAFPNGVNPLIDQKELASQILKANGIETKTMFFFDNGDLGKQLMNHGPLNIDGIDTSALQPQVDSITVNSNFDHGHPPHQLQMELLRKAYPDGVPDTLDTGAFMDILKQANPDANFHPGKGGYFSETFTIPDMTIPKEDYGFDASKLANKSFDSDSSLDM